MPMWPREVEEYVRAAGKISLFLDFDGTLVPIVADPAKAWLDASARDALATLSSKHGIVTTIISGRAIDDLRMRVNLPDIIYAGNRGLEISGPQFEFIEPVASSRSMHLLHLTDVLASDLQSLPGVSVEFKGLTSTVHYRQAIDADIPVIERAVRAAIEPVAALFQVEAGKQAFDIVPRTRWHKGHAVAWINERLGLQDALCIYFGDDGSDEDAFGTLSQAITFRVGADSESKAKYRVESSAEVREFLQWLVITK
jgi:trehalose-phosphatase